MPLAIRFFVSLAIGVWLFELSVYQTPLAGLTLWMLISQIIAIFSLVGAVINFWGIVEQGSLSPKNWPSWINTLLLYLGIFAFLGFAAVFLSELSIAIKTSIFGYGYLVLIAAAIYFTFKSNKQ
jgi:hypothetical protein